MDALSDSNAMVVHFGLSPPERTVAALRRMDRGNCTHARATWVSERYYGVWSKSLELAGCNELFVPFRT